MSYYHDNHWEEFHDTVEECSFTGWNASDKLLQLTDRVQEKRLKTVTRLLKESEKLGCRVEFCSEKDSDDDNPFIGHETCRGLYTETDSWIYINIDKIKPYRNNETNVLCFLPPQDSSNRPLVESDHEFDELMKYAHWIELHNESNSCLCP